MNADDEPRRWLDLADGWLPNARGSTHDELATRHKKVCITCMMFSELLFGNP